jgi:hypothetical protein
MRRLLLVDPDYLDHPSNVRRVFGSRMSDLSQTPPVSKVEIMRRHCGEIGLTTSIECIQGDVRCDEVLRAVLDADIILCTTDSHSSRAVLNAAAYAYHLPLIDGGVRVGRRHELYMAGLAAEVRISAPGTPCLWCRGTLSAERIREENLPDEQRQQLQQEGYVIGSPGPQPSLCALTVMGAGMMSCALLAMLQSDAVDLPDSYMFDGHFGDSPRIPEVALRVDCSCHRLLGMADEADLGLR